MSVTKNPRCIAGAAETKTECESTPSGDAVAVYASAVGELFEENIRAPILYFLGKKYIENIISVYLSVDGSEIL